MKKCILFLYNPIRRLFYLYLKNCLVIFISLFIFFCLFILMDVYCNFLNTLKINTHLNRRGGELGRWRDCQSEWVVEL